MYKHFYELNKNPFEITPDPSFLFATRKHNEALAALYYGVRRHKGFVVLTGEVGTGKTLLVRCLLQLLRKSDVSYAYVFNPCLSPMEFLQYIAGDFRLPAPTQSKSELLHALGTYVVSRFERGLTTVLVIDEAHHLSADVLEEVRLLTNLETAQDKLLQILLIGQQELDEKLDSSNLRQLKQRIALRSHLSALDLVETRGYVYSRLHLAGNPKPADVFPMATIIEVHRYARGFPRLINTLCENALIHGYARQSRWITPEMIEEIASEFRLNVGEPTLRAWKTEGPSAEVERAARTLLELYASLQRAGESTTSLGIAMGAGVQRDEPVI